MKLEAARSIIASAPNTHLAEAARTVLALLDACDVGRLEAAEAQQSVHINALEVAKQDLRALADESNTWRERAERAEEDYSTCYRMLQVAVQARDLVAKELEEARKPDPDLPRLRALEATCRVLVAARPPLRVEGRAAYNQIVAHLKPHL